VISPRSRTEADWYLPASDESALPIIAASLATLREDESD
jgi:NADPH-dependent ferric siderophore reductase